MNSSSLFHKLFGLLFSHIGLLILVLIYMIAGAFLFQMLEQNATIQHCQEGAGIESRTISKYRKLLYNYIRSNLWVDENMNENETQEYARNFVLDSNLQHNSRIKAIIKEYRNEILAIENEYNYYGQNCSMDNSWDFQSSFLFSASLITTIGNKNNPLFFCHLKKKKL